MEEFIKFSNMKDADIVTSTNTNALEVSDIVFKLSKLEAKRFENWKKEGCVAIKFEFKGEVNKISVQAKNNKWVDITDYGCW